MFKKPSNQWMAANMNEVEYLAYFMSRCIQGPKGCLEFQGGKNEKGYGQVMVKSKRWMVHRFVYTMTKGPIPDGHLILHSCDNPPCCNPAHLFPGTMVDNAQDSADKMRHFNGRKTHCKHGHEFTDANTLMTAVTGRPGLFRRQCLECNRIRMNSVEYKAQAAERRRRAKQQQEAPL